MAGQGHQVSAGFSGLPFSVQQHSLTQTAGVYDGKLDKTLDKV